MAFLKTGDGGNGGSSGEGVRFNLTNPNPSTITDFVGYGIYSPTDRTVRIYICVRGSNTASDTIASDVPSEYRPTTNQLLLMLHKPSELTAGCVVRSDGTIRQYLSSSFEGGLVVGEYKI